MEPDRRVRRVLQHPDALRTFTDDTGGYTGGGFYGEKYHFVFDVFSTIAESGDDWVTSGVSVTVANGATLRLVPDAAVILIVIGIFPWLARIVPRLSGLDVTRRGTAVGCGGVVTAAQLFAGASGPLLDVFYLNSRLNRHQVTASKALTQTIGHLLKLVYYGGILALPIPARRREDLALPVRLLS